MLAEREPWSRLGFITISGASFRHSRRDWGGKEGEVKLRFEGSDLEIRVSRDMDFVRPNFDCLNFECSVAAQQPKLACSVADHFHHA